MRYHQHNLLLLHGYHKGNLLLLHAHWLRQSQQHVQIEQEGSYLFEEITDEWPSSVMVHSWENLRRYIGRGRTYLTVVLTEIF
jgi:hypothetical protein